MTEERNRPQPRYEFGRYVHRGRWVTYWHQLDEVLSRNPESVLEIGPGPGVFKAVAGLFGVRVETVDLAVELKPDHVASAADLPFSDDAYDIVCAFQILEHLPYDQSLKAFAEMIRVSKKHLVVSLPDSRLIWFYHIHVPMYGPIQLMLPKPRLQAPAHVFDGDHYWEIGKRDYALSRVISDMSQQGATLVKTYRFFESPFHRFFVWEKSRAESAPGQDKCFDGVG